MILEYAAYVQVKIMQLYAFHPIWVLAQKYNTHINIHNLYQFILIIIELYILYLDNYTRTYRI